MNTKKLENKKATKKLLTALVATIMISVPALAQDAYIRAIHLSPDAPSVDVWVDKTVKAIEMLDFEESSVYLNLPSGIHTFDIVPAGSPVEDSVLTVEDLNLMPGNYYTAAAYDFLTGLSALALLDDNTAVPGDNIRLRAIHTASGVGEVDIWLIPETGAPSPLWVDLGYGETGSYLEVPPAAYTLGFDVDNDAAPDLIFDVPALPSGTIANVFAVRDTMGSIFLIAQLPDGSTARIDARPDPASIRVIHLSPDAPAVDVWVNQTTKAVSDLSFPEGTIYLQLPPDTYTFDVAPAGTSAASSVLTILDLALESGVYYTAAAFDFLADIQPLALVDDMSEVSAGNIRLRAIHTASGVGEVDIWLIPETGAPSPLWVDLGYGETGSYLEVPPAAYTLGFDVDNDAAPDLIFDVPALPAGTIANVFAVRDTMGSVFLIAQLGDGTTARIDAENACDTFGVDMVIPSTYVSPGDDFYVMANICNPGETVMDAPFFAVLDIGTGEYWFYPSWKKYPSEIDFQPIDLPTGITTENVLPQFQWPDTGTASWNDIHVFGAVLNPELTEIVGVYDVVTFGFGPAR